MNHDSEYEGIEELPLTGSRTPLELYFAQYQVQLDKELGHESNVPSFGRPRDSVAAGGQMWLRIRSSTSIIHISQAPTFLHPQPLHDRPSARQTVQIHPRTGLPFPISTCLILSATLLTLTGAIVQPGTFSQCLCDDGK
jgi:hypothetical protein